MRIGMLTTGYPHARDPVTGAFVRGMALALAARGHTLRVLCARKPGDAPTQDRGIEVIPVRYALRDAWARTFYGAGAPDALAAGGATAWAGALGFSTALWLRARDELRDCDAVISHFVIPCGVVGGTVRASRPHVCVAHGTDAWWFSRAPASVQRAVLQRTSALRFTHRGPWNALDARVREDARVSVGPTGFSPAPRIDPLRRTQLRERVGVRAGVTLLLGVGRMVVLKGWDVLLEAMKALGRENVLVLLGDGPERAGLISRANSLGLRVWADGAVDAATRDAWLGAADVFVAPSRVLADGRTEGAPVSVMEAMGAGLAVVASDTGGMRELIGDAGVLVPPGDACALERALRGLITDVTRRAELGERARRRADAWRWDVQMDWLERALTRSTMERQHGPV